MVARIPPNGHPENKWVTSREAAENSPVVGFNTQSSEYEVQYTADGSIGPPIIQPNKIEFLSQAALKLGRDIAKLSEALANPASFTDTSKRSMWTKGQQALRDHMNRLAADNGLKADCTGFTSLEAPFENLPDKPDAKDVSIRKMLRDLNNIAPDLVEEAGITIATEVQAPVTEQSNADAARVVQMQILEEMNNCWEPLFPEDEHVWQFAASRVDRQHRSQDGRVVRSLNKQYFNMRRWPLQCQSEATQAKYKKNTLTIQERPVTPEPEPRLTRMEMMLKKKEDLKRNGRYTGRGQPPSFNLGETPLQQAFLSMEIETHLADGKDLMRVYATGQY